jgi:hypothetical protein
MRRPDCAAAARHTASGLGPLAGPSPGGTRTRRGWPRSGAAPLFVAVPAVNLTGKRCRSLGLLPPRNPTTTPLAPGAPAAIKRGSARRAARLEAPLKARASLPSLSFTPLLKGPHPCPGGPSPCPFSLLCFM